VRKPDRSRGHAVFVDQPAEPIASAHTLIGVRVGKVERRSILPRRREAERAVRAVGVVVVDESAERTFELAPACEQEPVEALDTDGTEEALGDGVRLRRAGTASG
jgi:hypothetical protein